MRLIASLVMCLALTACATDYGSQLLAPNFGRQSLYPSDAMLDPSQLMDGAYSLGPGASFCLTTTSCSRQAPLWSSGWAP